MGRNITLSLTPAELEALRSLLVAYSEGYVPEPDSDLDNLHDYLLDVS